jgi:hypothetical protein
MKHIFLGFLEIIKRERVDFSVCTENIFIRGGKYMILTS